jgi:hypothetical protein
MNTCRMNNIHLNNHWVIKEIRAEIKNSQNQIKPLGYSRGKLIPMSNYIKKSERSQIMMDLKLLKKTNQTQN